MNQIKTQRSPLQWIFLLLLVGGLVLGLGVMQFHQIMSSALKLDEPEQITFQQGSALLHFVDAMGERGLLGSEENIPLIRNCVRLYALLGGKGNTLHAGEYQVVPGDSLYDVLAKLEQGAVVQHSLTIVEGWSMRELRSFFARQDKLEQKLPSFTDEQLMDHLGKPGQTPEGWFAPETYFYTSGISDLEILERALLRQQQQLAQAWQERDQNLPYQQPYEVLIMASIVEKETGAAYERPQIAGVFVRRLQKGMRLQTDPTVIYGLGDQYQGNLTRKHLRTPTPWNTYTNSGLPPTPIAMPGREAIFAAVHPEEGDALYFVAKGDGTHAFSSSLQEHEEKVQQFQLNRKAGYRSSPQ